MATIIDFHAYKTNFDILKIQIYNMNTIKSPVKVLKKIFSQNFYKLRSKDNEISSLCGKKYC